MSSKKRILRIWGMYLFLIIMALIFILPMLFTILASTKTNIEIFSKPFSLPEKIQWGNYITAWRDAKMGTYLGNSIIQTLLAVILVAVVASLVSFLLARFDFRGKKILTAFFAMGLLIPMHTVIVPIAYVIGTFNLRNNVAALILNYAAFQLPLSIIILTNFMKGINKSLEDAAMIDGATYFQIFRFVALPLSVPAISTISIFNFLSTWNNILFPLLYISDSTKKPISLGLLNFKGEAMNDYGPLMASVVITVVIPFLIYMLFQEKVEGGLAAGAVKE